jgi:hypothetical protein
MNFIGMSYKAPTKPGFTSTPREKGLCIENVFYMNFRYGPCGG